MENKERIETFAAIDEVVAANPEDHWFERALFVCVLLAGIGLALIVATAVNGGIVFG